MTIWVLVEVLVEVIQKDFYYTTWEILVNSIIDNLYSAHTTNMTFVALKMKKVGT